MNLTQSGCALAGTLPGIGTLHGTFVKESVSGPATEPVAPLTVHVDAGATTSTVLVAVAPPS